MKGIFINLPAQDVKSCRYTVTVVGYRPVPPLRIWLRQSSNFFRYNNPPSLAFFSKGLAYIHARFPLIHTDRSSLNFHALLQ